MALKIDLQRLNILTAGAAASVKTGDGQRANLQEYTAEESGHALNDPKESSWLTGDRRQTGYSPPLTK